MPPPCTDSVATHVRAWALPSDATHPPGAGDGSDVAPVGPVGVFGAAVPPSAVQADAPSARKSTTAGNGCFTTPP
jgi:hypothetical protein